ncbi:hypothetical protein AAMO2058_001464700 [Amorphochlora amoebiformis]
MNCQPMHLYVPPMSQILILFNPGRIPGFEDITLRDTGDLGMTSTTHRKRKSPPDKALEGTRKHPKRHYGVVVSESPRIISVSGFMSKEECERMIRICLPHTSQLPGCRKLRCEPGLIPNISQDDKRFTDEIEDRIGRLLHTPPHSQETSLNVNATPPDGAKIDKKSGDVVNLPPMEMGPCFEFPGSSELIPLGLHIDTHNGKPLRFATAIVYLTSLQSGEGGYTVFPCALPLNSQKPASFDRHHLSTTNAGSDLRDPFSIANPAASAPHPPQASQAGQWLLSHDILHTSTAFTFDPQIQPKNSNEQASNEQASNEQGSNEQDSNEQDSNEQVESKEQESNEQGSNEQDSNEQLESNEQDSSSISPSPSEMEKKAMQLIEQADLLVNASDAPDRKSNRPPAIGLAFRPTMGTLCLFYHIDPTRITLPTNASGDQGLPSDPRSWHGGARV